jgi:hypothetical protein
MAPDFAGAEAVNVPEGEYMLDYDMELDRCCARLGEFYEAKFKPAVDLICFGGLSSEKDIIPRRQKRTSAQLATSSGDTLPFKLLRSQSRRSILTPRDLNVQYKEQPVQQSYTVRASKQQATPPGDVLKAPFGGSQPRNVEKKNFRSPSSQENKLLDVEAGEDRSTVSTLKGNARKTTRDLLHSSTVGRPASIKKGRLSGMR